MTSAISTNNTSTELLEAGESFIGIADDVSKYSSCVVMVSSDQAGTCKVQHSMDGVNWDLSDITAYSGTPMSIQVELKGRYNRILYINGSTNQGYFRLLTMYKQLAQKVSLDSSAMTCTLDAGSQIKAMATDGSNDVQLSVDGSGYLQVVNKQTLSAANDAVSIMGDDGAGGKRQVLVDLDGKLQTITSFASDPKVVLKASDGSTARNVKCNGDGEVFVVLSGDSASLGIGSLPEVTLVAGQSVNIGTMPAVDVNQVSALPYRNLDVNSTSAQIKGSAGKLYGITINNLSAFSDSFVKLYDKASSATTSDTPIMTIYGIANTSTSHMFPVPVAFSNGLQIRSTQDLADASSVGSSNCAVNVVYA